LKGWVTERGGLGGGKIARTATLWWGDVKTPDNQGNKGNRKHQKRLKNNKNKRRSQRGVGHQKFPRKTLREKKKKQKGKEQKKMGGGGKKCLGTGLAYRFKQGTGIGTDGKESEKKEPSMHKKETGW